MVKLVTFSCEYSLKRKNWSLQTTRTLQTTLKNFQYRYYDLLRHVSVDCLVQLKIQIIIKFNQHKN